MKTATCGTNGGYQRHMKRGEQPCADCRAAATTYQRTYRRERGMTQSALVPLHVIEAAARQVDPGIAKALRAAMRAKA